MDRDEKPFTLNGIKFVPVGCRVCKAGLLIACDDPAALYDIYVKHPTHEVYLGREDEVATWSQDAEGRFGANYKDNIILRIEEAGLTIHGVPMGYRRQPELKKDLAPYTSCTAKQFMEFYATDSGVTVQFLKDHHRKPIFVQSCSQYHFPHWEMGYINEPDPS